MATRYDATKVFVPISAVIKGEGDAGPTHQHNTRQAAQKWQQQIGSHDRPSQETQYNKQMTQFQDPNRTDVPHGNGITQSGPNVDRSQKLVKSSKPVTLSGRSNPAVPGRPMRVHDYEPIPGLADRSQNNPNMESPSKPYGQPSSLSHQRQLEDNKPEHSAVMNENPYNLEKGSLIEFSNPPKYGVIKWIGYLSGISKKCRIAGVEMVNSIVIAS